MKSLSSYPWLLIGVLALGIPSVLPASEPAAADTLRIDIPVTLKEARVVFNLDHLAFEGDNPTGLNFMTAVLKDFALVKTNYKIVGVFHGAAGYMALNDERYNAVRQTPRGNPYQALIKALQDQGVQFELCAVTARNNGWTNADTLPGVKVVTSANLRIIELVKDGYIQIQP
jgi:intracellular sulfur oxidation DsrE/DsrF family protein